MREAVEPQATRRQVAPVCLRDCCGSLLDNNWGGGKYRVMNRDQQTIQQRGCFPDQWRMGEGWQPESLWIWYMRGLQSSRDGLWGTQGRPQESGAPRGALSGQFVQKTG